jgi:hypothetical protein
MKITLVKCCSTLLLALAALAQQPASQPPQEHSTRTRVVLLGTGTPVPDPDRSGPATAIVVDESAYLVDFGPGVGLLIVYHGWISWWPGATSSGNQPSGPVTGEFHSTPELLQKEIGSRYSGNFVVGRDLDVY